MFSEFFENFGATGLVIENKIIFVFNVSLSLFVIYLAAALLVIINLLAGEK